MENIFRKIKRHISQYFEMNYWYIFRKLATKYWYDEDEKKYVKYDRRGYKNQFPFRARDITVNTWEGEWDIWNMVLLKLDHMFWNLHKYGNESSYYFYSSDIDKYANENDKVILAKKVLKSALFDDRVVGRHSLWIGNVDVSEKTSDDKLLHVFLEYYEKSNRLYLIIKSKSLIPSNEIKKKDKFYTIDSYIDENGKRQFTHTEAKQYREKNSRLLDSWSLSEDKDKAVDFIYNQLDNIMNKRISEYLESGYDIKWNMKTIEDVAIERLDQYTPEISIEEVPLFSEELRRYATGNFVKCKRILHLRHLIKNLMKISENDSKYDYLWIDEKDDNQRLISMKEARVHYEADRKQAYQEVMDYMLKYSQQWWD